MIAMPADKPPFIELGVVALILLSGTVSPAAFADAPEHRRTLGQGERLGGNGSTPASSANGREGCGCDGYTDWLHHKAEAKRIFVMQSPKFRLTVPIAAGTTMDAARKAAIRESMVELMTTLGRMSAERPSRSDDAESSGEPSSRPNRDRSPEFAPETETRLEAPSQSNVADGPTLPESDDDRRTAEQTQRKVEVLDRIAAELQQLAATPKRRSEPDLRLDGRGERRELPALADLTAAMERTARDLNNFREQLRRHEVLLKQQGEAHRKLVAEQTAKLTAEIVPLRAAVRRDSVDSHRVKAVEREFRAERDRLQKQNAELRKMVDQLEAKLKTSERETREERRRQDQAAKAAKRRAEQAAKRKKKEAQDGKDNENSRSEKPKSHSKDCECDRCRNDSEGSESPRGK